MEALPPAPTEAAHPLSDRWAVLLAVSAVAGTTIGGPLPLALGVGVALLAAVARRPWLLCAAVGLLGCTLGARAEDGLRPVTAARYEGPVTLVTDPAPSFRGVRAVVRVGSRRLELRANKGAVGAVAASLAGERVIVDGRIRPVEPLPPWLRVRHVVGRLDVSVAERHDAGRSPWRQANAARRLLDRGAASLPPAERSLFTGFVFGDDRQQPAAMVDDFRAAGLTHLLAVSGQNVAFVLAVLAPAVRRLALRGRFVATLAAIAFFAVVTRAEPSVLRASAMAALAVTATTIGRRASPVRLLALSVTALVLIDPLLVESVGFRLSVGASLGIVTLAHRIAEAIPGPRFLAEALSVTLAAQLGVAPVLVSTFGGLPVASMPANLLAVPAAGLVMMWGLAAGVVAGLVGGPVAAALHTPTGLLVRWVAGVARQAAALPLGELGAREIALLAGGVAVAVTATRRGRRGLAAVGAGGAVCTLLLPAVALRTMSPPLRTNPVSGLELWRSGGATVVVVAGSPPIGTTMEALRRSGVRRLDLVVVRSRGPAAAERVAALRHRWAVGRVLQPADGNVPAAVRARAGGSFTVGPLAVEVRSARPRLEVEVLVRPSTRVARPPPDRRRAQSGSSGTDSAGRRPN